MKHIMNVSVSESTRSSEKIQFRKIPVRERILTRLFGAARQVVVLIPGNTVQTVSITEVPGAAEEDAHNPMSSMCRERGRYETVRS